MSLNEGEMVVQVIYPLAAGSRMVLRTDQDWSRDVAPFEVSLDRRRVTFRFAATGPFHYFKPLLYLGEIEQWAQGNNYLIFANGGSLREIYPHFFGDRQCSACALKELGEGEDLHEFRVFYPPGYEENYLKRYPVIYMQDGQNLFFPDEAFGGRHWRIDETLLVLEQMNAIDKLIVVGIYPKDRIRDYTKPGYEAYGRYIVHQLKPHIDANYRTLVGPATTALMGSSLGGVVSFYLAWQYPEVFGMAACMSSTFGYQDDLRSRVLQEEKRPLRFYLDSGWPYDNYEVTRDMRNLLLRSGYELGKDLVYLAFPEALHNEQYWAMRAHIPIQLFFGRVRRGE